MTEEHTPPSDRRRRFLPWAIAIALVVIAATAAAAFLGGDESVAPLAGPAGTTQGSATAGLATDEPAPDFDADAFDGSVFRLSDHLATDGRPVFLNLWASWCFPCREEMPAIDAVAAANPDVMFIGVAVEDDPVAAEEFGNEIGVSYLLAIDESGEVSAKYPALGLPASFLISSDGRVVAKLFGGASAETFQEFLGNHDA